MKASKYKKLTPREHVLLRPDTYIGSIETEKNSMYVVDDNNLEDINISKKDIDYNPGFIKIFDEALVNASDHAIRTGSVSYIKVDITDDSVTIENDGEGIPIEIHPEYDVYVPQLIFAELLTGENYDDTQDRVVGGRNGLGIKLTSIFSKKFIIECCDGINKYKQVVESNMSVINKPSIRKAPKNSKTYTKITYFPDYEKFSMNETTQDSKSLMIKRCIDVAAYNRDVKISINKKRLPIKTIKDFMLMHLEEGCEFFHEKLSNGWEIGIAKAPNNVFDHISIVNGITTYRGGTHVSYIANNLSKEISDSLSKKIKASWADVKNKLFVFLVSQVPNPAFDTQTKENLTTYISKEISGGCNISDKNVKKILKSEIIKSFMEEIAMKEKLALKRKQKKKQKIEKLVDATSKNRKDCELWIFEGFSAGNAARDHRDTKTQGYYLLKGKFVNVRKKSDKGIVDNKEALGLMNSIGLILNEDVDIEDLRYNKIVLSADSDMDGYGICGLLMNFFSKWKELFDHGFIYRSLTPILALTKGKKTRYFYTYTEWEDFQKINSLKGYEISYKKGLGSLSDQEYSDMLNNPKLVKVTWDDLAENNLENWFGKESDLRKDILTSIKERCILDETGNVSISQFMNNEYTEFSMYVLEDRAIASVIDGLKPVQRKAVYVAQKHIRKSFNKVTTLAGKIISDSNYHHGNVSAENAIVNMAQDFKNNLPLFDRDGQFGTINTPDNSATRYISVRLAQIYDMLYKDTDLLNYKEDEGMSIEPEFYLPIIPMILANGCDGIAVGFASTILKRDPYNIIDRCISHLSGKNIRSMKPYYARFNGEIDNYGDSNIKWVLKGNFKRLNKTTVEINELPVSLSSAKLEEHLNKLEDNKKIVSFEENKNNIFTIKMTSSELSESSDQDLIEMFKLQEYITENYVTLDEHGKLKIFESDTEILKYFTDKRLEYYFKRKEKQIEDITEEIRIKSLKAEFIKLILNNKIVINKKSKAQVTAQLEKLKFGKVNDSYDFLLTMQIYMLTKEKYKEFLDNIKNLKADKKEIIASNPKEVYIEELKELKTKLKKLKI